MGGKPRQRISAKHRREMELLHELMNNHGYSIYEIHPKTERFQSVHSLKNTRERISLMRVVRLMVPVDTALADAMGEGD